MSYRLQLTKMTDKAFRLLKDLATDIKFKHSSSVFNFGTGLVNEVASPIKVVKAVILKTTKKDNINTVSLLLKSVDFVSVKQYDVIEITGIDYKIGSDIVDDGYTVVLEATKNG